MILMLLGWHGSGRALQIMASTLLYPSINGPHARLIRLVLCFWLRKREVVVSLYGSAWGAARKA